MEKIAVFLDRDGVITEDPPHYAHRLNQLFIIPGSAEAISHLNRHNYAVIVITNQSGVARGMYEESDINIFNEEMKKRLQKKGAHIDALYYCPHHPQGPILEYKHNCNCRKPKPGMLLKAKRELGINLKKSYLIGDKWTDIEAGKAVGCKTILVMTGHGMNEYAEKRNSADYYAENLLSAVTDIILEEYNEDISRSCES
jgi:D,D-heptose 1,7-bisphosphate phosphatase